MTGGAASGKKGASYERELVDRLRDAGYGALRLPSSGSATERDLPDVLAGCKNDWRDYLDTIAEPFTVNRSHTNALTAAQNIGRKSDLMAVECKSGKATTLYVDESEVDALEAFAATWGATPYLGARSTRQGTPTGHFLVAPDDARRTDAAYGLPIDGIAERVSVVVGAEGVREP